MPRISINSEKGLQVSWPVVVFSNPFCDGMAILVLTAIVQSHMHYRAKACAQDYMNMPNAKGNSL